MVISATLDLQIGHRIKALRIERKLTQQKLAESLNISFQQIQKYERAINRISAGRLYEVAQFFNVPITFFYESEASLKFLRELETVKTSSSLRLQEGQRPFSHLSTPQDDSNESNEADEANEARKEDDIFKRANLNYEETRQLLSAYYDISDYDMRKHILSLIEKLGSAVTLKK